jgi:ADP-glucose pyrophosphorylase
VLFDVLAGSQHDFRGEIIPSSLERYRVNAYLHRGYWADVGTIASARSIRIRVSCPPRG